MGLTVYCASFLHCIAWLRHTVANTAQEVAGELAVSNLL
jgi:hypothetical protein